MIEKVKVVLRYPKERMGSPMKHAWSVTGENKTQKQISQNIQVTIRFAKTKLSWNSFHTFSQESSKTLSHTSKPFIPSSIPNPVRFLHGRLHRMDFSAFLHHGNI